jgi:hypothetical protein
MIRSRIVGVSVGDAHDMQLPGTALGLRPLHIDDSFFQSCSRSQDV